MRERAHVQHAAFLGLVTERGGGTVERLDGITGVAASHPFPFLNAALATGRVEDGEQSLERVNRFFAANGRDSWTLLARDTGEDEPLEVAARSRGLEIVNPNYPEMVCMRPCDVIEPSAGLELREVSGPDDAAAYWRICGEAYQSLGFPHDLFDAYVPRLLDPPVVGCLAWLDGVPVGAAMASVFEGVGLVFWVATLASARGRGVGAAVTAWATNRAFADGADFVSLQASPMGRAVYERLGYEHAFGYRVWRATGA